MEALFGSMNSLLIFASRFLNVNNAFLFCIIVSWEWWGGSSNLFRPLINLNLSQMWNPQLTVIYSAKLWNLYSIRFEWNWIQWMLDYVHIEIYTRNRDDEV
jgi:hypothetical protein